MNYETQCLHKEKQHLYKIGMFSQINRITVKTLRYYDEVDLLKPEYVDQENGYRYYTSSQLPKLHRILALREMDFSITEIKQVFEGTAETKLLVRKKSELLNELANISKKIACVESYLSRDVLQDEYRVIMKSLPQMNVAYRKLYLSSYADLFHHMPEMGLAMEQAGCACAVPENCFTTYLDNEYRETDINAEICEAVTELKEDNEDICFKFIPEVEYAACVLHKGPYDQLPQAYSAIVLFIEENGYEIVGNQREVYIDGVWNKDTPNEWLTEIQFPVKKNS